MVLHEKMIYLFCSYLKTLACTYKTPFRKSGHICIYVYMYSSIYILAICVMYLGAKYLLSYPQPAVTLPFRVYHGGKQLYIAIYIASYNSIDNIIDNMKHMAIL